MNDITFTPGIISLTNARGVTLTLSELPLDGFEELYRLWVNAFSRVNKDNSDHTFFSLWVTDGEFRNLLTRCLTIFGIEKVGDLKPEQLKELVLGSNSQPPLIFQLHNETVPKLQTVQKPIKPPKKWSMTGLIQRVTSCVRYWVTDLYLGLTP